MFLPTIVANGQVVGTWKRTIKKKGIEFLIIPFGPFEEKEKVAIAAERYAAFIGLPLSQIVFE
ncbi:hypothetical protein D3C87_2008990 [compost metagenome]